MIYKPLISVIIPVYNAEKYIERCIDSIIKQTYSNIEIIIVNDGSQDNTINVLNKYKNMKSVFVYSKKNTGAFQSRIYGVNKCRGEYITFVDADDWIECNMIKELVDVTDCGSIDYIMCGMFIDTDKRTEVNDIKNKRINTNRKIRTEIYDYFVNESISGPCCKLIRKDLFDNINISLPFEVVLQEDLYLNIKLLEKVDSFVSVSKYYYHYVYNDNSITNRYIDNKFMMTSYVFKQMISFFYGHLGNYEMTQIRWLQIKNLYAAIIDLNLPDCKYNYKKKLECISNWKNSDLIKDTLSCMNYKYLCKKKRLLFSLVKTNNVSLYYICKVMYILKYTLGMRL